MFHPEPVAAEQGHLALHLMRLTLAPLATSLGLSGVVGASWQPHSRGGAALGARAAGRGRVPCVASGGVPCGRRRGSLRPVWPELRRVPRSPWGLRRA